MDYVRLGGTGLTVSRICLGMMTYGDPGWREWVLGEDAAAPIVRRAADLGITFFDTADMYSQGVSEEITGRLLRSAFGNREDFVLATKVFFPVGPGRNDRGLSRKHILAGIDASLRRLGTDHVDLYQIHRWDRDTPIEETMEALHDVVRAGKARYLGASSMHAWQFAKAQHVAERHGWTKFVSMQPQYNLAYREDEREMLPFCQDSGVGVIPWSPLAKGMLARGRDLASQRARTDTLLQRLSDEDDFRVADVVQDIAKRRGVPAARVALAWVLSRPVVTAPIIGASKVSHIEDAVAAVDLTLTGEECAALEAPYRPHDLIGY